MRKYKRCIISQTIKSEGRKGHTWGWKQTKYDYNVRKFKNTIYGKIEKKTSKKMM